MSLIDIEYIFSAGFRRELSSLDILSLIANPKSSLPCSAASLAYAANSCVRLSVRFAVI